ncbi:MAG: [FeFe] hydrogenase H-cluster maturation GTPase HydF [Spirochaetales bacterium]|nr:[FeFe] hydrogenase H-cluster maturation GTPase HydF [Spirochaetales bacterium]
MGLNNTPASERVHIGIFGKRNAGKSSLINAITGQNLAVVSPIAGTTTDPVVKSMELLPLGPVLFIDTPGLDDVGELGKMRIEKSYQALNKTDIALLAIDGTTGMTEDDRILIKHLKQKNIPFIIVMTKADEVSSHPVQNDLAENTIWVSSKTGENIWELKELTAKLLPNGGKTNRIVGDLLQPGDFVILVVPIDSAAPKGRLILPQQQTIRDILEAGAVSIVVKETELEETLKNIGKKPKLVITDSQAFAKVSKITPNDILLTSFSILFARYKGDLETAVQGAKALETVHEGDTILISEGCTHHRQCEDIGTVKLPRWIEEYTGKKLDFKFSSGTEFPQDLSSYKMIIHCGACTLNEREVKYRMQSAKNQNVPITNYGILISYMQKILARCIAAFPEFQTKV